MITYDDLGKRWDEKRYHWCKQHALTITDDGVLLGSDCVICKGRLLERNASSEVRRASA